jgi:hypothetical protein
VDGHASKYGTYATTWRRLKRWKEGGIWARIIEAFISKGYAIGSSSTSGTAG